MGEHTLKQHRRMCKELLHPKYKKVEPEGVMKNKNKHTHTTFSRKSFPYIPLSRTTFINTVKNFWTNQNGISKEIDSPLIIQSALIWSTTFCSTFFFFFIWEEIFLPHPPRKLLLRTQTQSEEGPRSWSYPRALPSRSTFRARAPELHWDLSARDLPQNSQINPVP